MGLARVVTSVGMAGVQQWGDGPPEVVLCHGAGGNRHSLAPLGDALDNLGVGVMTVSMPGRDGSDGAGIASIGEAATWLAAMLAEVAPDGTVLLGHSMGGAVAIETVMSTDACVRGLVLAATGARLRVLPAILDLADELAATGASHDVITAAGLQPDAPAGLREHGLADAR